MSKSSPVTQTASHPNPLESARIEKGLSKLALANKSGISRTTLDRREQRPDLMTLRDLSDLARALGANPYRLAEQILEQLDPETLAAA